MIFFIPGYYGSHLTRVQDDKQIFLSGSNLIPNRPLAKLDSSEYRAEVMERVTVGPFSTEVYAPALNKLRKKYGTGRVIPLGYDWRAPFEESAAKLNFFIENSWDNESPIFIIAHSMGGLVYSHLLKKANASGSSWQKNLKQVTIVASPLRGSVPMLRNLTIGTPFPYNATLLIPENLWTYASPFHMLPESIPVLEGEKSNGFLTQDPLFWKRYILPRLNFPVSAELLKEKISYMTQTRAAVNELFSTPKNYKIKIIVAQNQKTPARFRLDSSGLIFDQYRILGLMFKKWDSAYYAPGDGTCTMESQLPPESLSTTAPAIPIANPHPAIDSKPETISLEQDPNLSIFRVSADHMKALESDEALSL